MRHTYIAAAALSLGLAAGASAALAADPSETDCRQMDSQVRTALTNTQSANRDQAAHERTTGQQFCTHGYYRVGISHYTQALKLLGAKT
jgi:hypothetical protein